MEISLDRLERFKFLTRIKPCVMHCVCILKIYNKPQEVVDSSDS